MIETLFKNQDKVQEHLRAPFLVDRESFIKERAKKGLCLRSLQMEADNLLAAVTLLNIKEDSHEKIQLETILGIESQWRDLKFWNFANTAIRLLSRLNLLDERYSDANNIFNSIFIKCFYRIKYLTYPLYEERKVYLDYLKRAGYSNNVVREYAEMQLHVVDLLRLESRREITIEEITGAADNAIGLRVA